MGNKYGKQIWELHKYKKNKKYKYTQVRMLTFTFYFHYSECDYSVCDYYGDYYGNETRYIISITLLSRFFRLRHPLNVSYLISYFFTQ